MKKKQSILIPLFCAAVLASGCAGTQGNSPSQNAAAAAGQTAGDPAQNSSSPSQDSAQPALAADESQTAELFAMDTVMSLTAYGPHAPEALRAAQAEINRLDALLSISNEDGDIFKLNRDGAADLSADSLTLLTRAQEFSAETDGLFDCTIEPVMEAWGFTTKNYRVPSREELDGLLSRVDYRQVAIDGSHVTLPEDVRLDLGGIAKGFTSARVMELFADQGVTSGIISLGGNVQALGAKPDGSPWRVGIQDPDDLNSMFAAIEITDEAVITSGAYQRFFEENGKHYHHIIDPRTGEPSDSGLTSVTIISDDGTLADALSTSLFIMGPEKAADFWRAHKDEFDAVMMKSDRSVLVTAGMADRCQILTQGHVEVIS